MRRGEGITKWFVGDITTVKVSAAQTDGRLGVLEVSIPPGRGPAPHAHGKEDESFYVLTGDFEFVNGDEVSKVGPGDFVWIPRGNRHGFTNLGATPGTVLAFFMPGGLEQLWIDNGEDPVPGEQPPNWGMERLSSLAEEAERYQMTILPDDPE